MQKVINTSRQGCQMVCFQTEIPNLTKFGGPWNRKCCYMYFMTVWNTLRPFGIVCGHLIYYFSLWYVWTTKNLATLHPDSLLHLDAKLRCHSMQVKTRFFATNDKNVLHLCEISWGQCYHNYVLYAGDFLPIFGEKNRRFYF
jgi:hypothetical protein